MSLRIVDRYPSPGVLRRLVRLVASLLGALLTLSGLASATLPLIFAVMFLFSVLSGDDPGSNLDNESVELLFLSTVFAVVALFVGRWLLRGRRRMVLFLRRFGFVDSSRALTYAVGTAVGRRWRVVTLDDAMQSPVGVSGRARWTFRLGRWIAILAVAICIFWAYMWFQGESPGQILSELFDGLLRDGTGNALERFFGALFGSVMIGLLLLLIIGGLMLIGITFLSTLAMFVWGAHRSVTKAERAKALRITRKSEIRSVVRKAVRRARRLFSPRLTVVRVAEDVWRATVVALAETASVVLIDVSDPGPNLLWEIETLRDRVGAPWVLVGRRDRLEALARGGATEEEAHLARLLAREEALPYELNDRHGLGRFAKSLSGRLESVG